MAPANELHYHECPTVGCHKQWTCTEAGCGPFYFKSCEAHEIKPPALAAPPSDPADTRTPEQKIADAASYAEMEKRNAQLLAATGEIMAGDTSPPASPAPPVEKPPEAPPPVAEVAPPSAPVAPSEPQAPGAPTSESSA